MKTAAPPDSAWSPVLTHARALAETWTDAGWAGCVATGPDGARVDLAGVGSLPVTTSAPMRGRLRGWTLDLCGDGPGRNRLTVDAEMLSALADRTCELAETTGALIDANDQLLAIYDLAGTSSTRDENRNLLADLTDDACRLTHGVAVLVLLDEDVETSSGPDDIVDALRRVANERDAAADRVVRGGDGNDFDVVVRGLRGSTDGSILIAGRPNLRFTTADLQRIEAVTYFLSGLISIEMLHRANLASAVIERDASTAAALARMILPSRAPRLPGIDVAARCEPARLAAGDFFTWVETPHGLVFAVGDVAGKGLGAALVMTMVTRATVRAAVTAPDADPTELFTALAGELTDYLSEANVFVTMVIGTYRPGDDVIRLANAGHSPVLVRVDGTTAPLPASAPPLGVLETLVPDTVELPFAVGDTVMIGTDGLAEQEDEHGRQIGYARLAELVDAHADRGAEGLVGALFDTVEEVTGDGDRADDRTALVLHRTETGDADTVRGAP